MRFPSPDQAISHGAGGIDAQSVNAMLGIAGRDEIGTLLDALATRDGQRLLAAADELAGRSLDLAAVLGEMQRAFHDLALAVELGTAPEAPYGRFAGAFSAEDLQLYYQIVLMGGRDLAFAPDPKIGFDMTMIRLLSFEPLGDARVAPASEVPAPTSVEPRPGPAVEHGAEAQLGALPEVAPSAPVAVEEPSAVEHSSDNDWHELVAAMGPEGVTLMILERRQLGPPGFGPVDHQT